MLEYELPPICEKDADIYNQIPKYKGMSIRELNNVVEKWHRYIIDEYIPDMLHYNLMMFLLLQKLFVFIQVRLNLVMLLLQVME